MRLDAGDEHLRSPGRYQGIKKARRPAAAERELFDHRLTRAKMRCHLRGGVAETARILLGDQERNVEQRRPADEERARLAHAVPAVKDRPIGLLEVDQDQHRAAAVEQARVSHADAPSRGIARGAMHGFGLAHGAGPR
jgi:hypothetical protein